MVRVYTFVCVLNGIRLAYDLQLIASRALCTLHSVHTAQYHYVTNFQCVVSCVCFGNGLFPCSCMMSSIPALHTHSYVNRYVYRGVARITGQAQRLKNSSQATPQAPAHTECTQNLFYNIHDAWTRSTYIYIIDNGVELLRAFKKRKKSYTNAIVHVVCVPSECGWCTHAHTIFTLKRCTPMCGGVACRCPCICVRHRIRRKVFRFAYSSGKCE